MTDHPSIAIIGAGLAGLACARVLQRNGLRVTVYELDPSAEARQQGGSLDIHKNQGQVALRAAGLYDQFRSRTHPSGEATRVLDKHAHVYIDEPEPKGGNGRPEIDRRVLRQLFVDSLTPGTIAWGRKLTEMERAGDGRHELRFADGSAVRADLVVGADGAWSKVRSALTPVRPAYTGITIVEIRLADAAARHPEALALTGTGSLFALSDGKYIGGHGGEQIALGVGMRVPADWMTTSGIDWGDPVAIRAALLNELDDWAEPLKDLIRESDDTMWPRPIYALPVGHTWPHVPGVTLVGDAAHLMSPFAGEGANLALLDGAELAEAIIGAPDLDRALIDYEKRMFPRGAKSAKDSQKGLERMFDERSPREIVAFFRRMNLLASLARPILRGLSRD